MLINETERIKIKHSSKRDTMDMSKMYEFSDYDIGSVNFQYVHSFILYQMIQQRPRRKVGFEDEQDGCN